MHMLNFRLFKALIVVMVFSLVACGPAATFTEPQPVNVKSITEFPKRLLGNYVSTLDSSMLCIAKTAIIRTYKVEIMEAVNKLDSSYTLSKDTLKCVLNGEKWPVEVRNDSIFGWMPIVDTVFAIDEHGILKKFKGHYFISNRLKGTTWEVKKLALSRSKLEMSGISNPEDIQKLKVITESSQDTLPYEFELTKKQFKRFVKDNGFSNTETFIKIKN